MKGLPRRFWEKKAELLFKEWDDHPDPYGAPLDEFRKINAKVEQAALISMMLDTMDAEVEKIREALEKEITKTVKTIEYPFTVMSEACKYVEITGETKQCLYHGRVDKDQGQPCCWSATHCPLFNNGEE